MGNSFGKIFKLTTFGESHGSMIGGVIEGCPAGVDIAEEDQARVTLLLLEKKTIKSPFFQVFLMVNQPELQ